MDYYSILKEMFTNKSSDVIHNIISIVEENSAEPEPYKLESMINLLSEIGGGTTPAVTTNFVQNDDELLDEAAGGYFECAAFNSNFENQNSSMSKTETLKRLMDMLPNADPSFLETKATELVGNEIALEEFITDAIESNKYPTLEVYLKNQENQRQKNQYVKNFHLRNFLKLFPDPLSHFNDPDRKHALADSTKINSDDEEYAKTFLYNFFNQLRTTDINKVFKICDRNLVKTFNRLRKLPKAFNEARKLKPPGEAPNNIPLLQEIAFLQHEQKFIDLLKLREDNYLQAKEFGLLETCGCCYFEELIPEECYFCRKGCIFCKDCVKRGTEAAIGQSKYDVACFSDNCDGEFSLSTLQMVLDEVTFKGLSDNKQAEEIKKANLEGVEYCPLGCNFAIIPDPDDMIFHCQVCNKDSCRNCKHLSHIPKKCNEIEYDEDVRMRTYIENKMSESLIRKCKRCDKVYIKNSGCNKITCSCGYIMCYLCGAEISGYDHFKQSTCPLFTDDNKIHLENVVRGGALAKAELGVDQNPDKLKFDPTRDIDLHFK